MGWTGLFRDAFTKSRNAIVRLDDQRRLVEVNAAFVALGRYPRSALIGRPLYDLLAHGQPTHTDRGWEEALRKPEFTGVSELVRADGERIRVNFAGCHGSATGAWPWRCTPLGPRGARPPRAGNPVPADLSGGELEVIEMIARGLSGPEIADALHLTHNTVRTHVRNSMVNGSALASAPCGHVARQGDAVEFACRGARGLGHLTRKLKRSPGPPWPAALP